MDTSQQQRLPLNQLLLYQYVFLKKSQIRPKLFLQPSSVTFPYKALFTT